MKILIADDDNVSRLLLASNLRKQGHEVVAVDDGLRALEAFHNGYFPMLILDWLMPRMDGLDLCRQVRKLQREYYTYIVLLTSLKGKSNYLEAMAAGVDDFMTKPFEADQLACRIHVAERIIDLQRSVAEGTRELRQKNEQIEKDLKMAHELQMALLPQHFPSIPPGALPTESAIKFSSFYYPMGAVSGDFFTVNRLSDTAVAVFILDVMGHGVRAGLITAMLRALIEKFSAAAADPGVMLSNINRSLLAILKNTDSNLFVTGFLPRRRCCALANALRECRPSRAAAVASPPRRTRVNESQQWRRTGTWLVCRSPIPNLRVPHGGRRFCHALYRWALRGGSTRRQNVQSRALDCCSTRARQAAIG